ncbi:NAD(P)H-dependent oxidoreductase [Ideonella azotifigens]|uniref:FMN dependent NADH:quinone oxidoreductase n=1 Tax=Ideonella azotifigens TaxID=513160 RepID=A0ABP3VW26_9BURK|nr:NAD(P)H-dependent oxidoreductase [Ideonella azotifigens]MCD2339182.1 NAD(P)H-dependent oxidoreductase [Ideonella azotifigens]
MTFMTTLLYIESSPRQQRSHSAAVARAFLDAYLTRHPEVELDTWDLWTPDLTLPEFDGAALSAKFAARSGLPHTQEEAAAWAEVSRHAQRLQRAELLLLSVPLWNFGVPYRFKHWLDVVTQPGLTFRPDPQKGMEGLLKARKALVVSARGGIYAPGSPTAAWDFVTPYLRHWLGMLGVPEVTVVGIDGTSISEARTQSARAGAMAEVQALATGF